VKSDHVREAVFNICDFVLMSRFMRALGLVSLVGLLLVGCAEPQQKSICREGGIVRSCSAKEQKVIDGMQSIITAVRNYQIKPESFYKLSVGKNPQVMLFGEDHTNVISKIETLGLMNYLLRRDEIILLEGGDWRSGVIPNCGIILIRDIFYAWEWLKLGRPYQGNFIEILDHQEHYYRILDITKESYDLADLAINDARCGYWDDKNERDGISYEKIEARNRTMTKAIDYWLPRSSGIKIQGGARHLPSGERMAAERSNPLANIPEDLSAYYALVNEQLKRPLARRSLQIDHWAGSTKPIHDYFKQNGISYAEYIHGSVVH